MEAEELRVELQDNEWPYSGTDHDRQIVRAIAFDEDGYFYFVRAERDDDFGKATLIETSGGGAEEGEELTSALRRELREELGAEADILCRIGVVSDYYHLIRRHNINNYYLCRIRTFGERHLTEDEAECFHLSTLKMSYGAAVKEYEKCSDTKLGRLIANRELPVLKRAGEIMTDKGLFFQNGSDEI
ncbi:NUDIX hydrolase [Ruminococcus sp.]|uniref:NUDIX domain-containing protein n=1 Tax=Ruminococcus sp. TaxID=41978 RepID=UPI0025DFE0CF|nr:NUDIX hydrolase [Ruminococcus sp.]MBQ8964949.1 NUDIX hydrolase [Ruminococcus sp.]